MPRDQDIDAGYSGPGGGGYSGNPRGEPSGFSGGGWNSVSEGGGDGRNRYRRRVRMKLPAEFADFKLADGRTLRDVMGDRFFGSAGGSGGGKWMSRGVRERLREGGSPFSGGMFENIDPKKLAELKAGRAEARARRAAEQQARRDERRVRMEARRAAHPGGNFNFGGGL